MLSIWLDDQGVSAFKLGLIEVFLHDTLQDITERIIERCFLLPDGILTAERLKEYDLTYLPMDAEPGVVPMILQENSLIPEWTNRVSVICLVSNKRIPSPIQ
jgi:hypothetical protein